MEFKGLLPLSLIEYPNKIVAVVHTGGCNFRCPFCYNRDLVLNPDSIPSVSEEEVIGLLKSRKRWLDGLAVTGGEPTIHPDLPRFLRRVKELSFLVELETNGSNPEMLEELIEEELVDYIAMDVKAPLTWERYKEIAGIKDKTIFEKVLKSIELLKRGKVDYEFRTTFVPDLLSEEDILAIAKELKGAKRYVLQQFTPRTPIDEKLEKSTPAPPEKLIDIKNKIHSMFQKFELRGVRDPR
ncbi:MAG: anaerobic ribonucleoside-triphosphate reductase activating protein [Hadesarchaea archaeon]|nr:anaerobic ribonucleoside-triphosphate reductase activating protein [Hadesarchaea archaeon]